MKTALLALAAALLAIGSSISQAQTPPLPPRVRQALDITAARLGVRVTCDFSLSEEQCLDGVGALGRTSIDDLPESVRALSIRAEGGFAHGTNTVQIPFSADHGEIEAILSAAQMAFAIHRNTGGRVMAFCNRVPTGMTFARCHPTLLTLYAHWREIPDFVENIFIGRGNNRVGRSTLVIDRYAHAEDIVAFLESLEAP